MSRLEVAIRKGVVEAHVRWNRPFDPSEWATFLDPLRPMLRSVEEAGGESDYVLFVLTSFRWRSPVLEEEPDLEECDNLLRVIDRVAAREGPLWKVFGKALRKLSAEVEETFFRDEGPFEAFVRSARGSRSRHTYRALASLDDHFRKAIKPRKMNREELLAAIADAVLMKYWDEGVSSRRRDSRLGSDNEITTLDWVHKRLQRAPQSVHEPIGKWIFAYSPQDMVIAYHGFHMANDLECGRACNDEPDWGR